MLKEFGHFFSSSSFEKEDEKKTRKSCLEEPCQKLAGFRQEFRHLNGNVFWNLVVSKLPKFPHFFENSTKILRTFGCPQSEVRMNKSFTLFHFCCCYCCCWFLICCRSLLKLKNDENNAKCNQSASHIIYWLRLFSIPSTTKNTPAPASEVAACQRYGSGTISFVPVGEASSHPSLCLNSNNAWPRLCKQLHRSSVEAWKLRC